MIMQQHNNIIDLPLTIKTGGDKMAAELLTA